MKLRRKIVSLLTLSVTIAVSQEVEDSYEIYTGGATRNLEISCTELFCTPVDGSPAHPIRISDKITAQRTFEHARAMEASTGNQMDLVLYETGSPRNAGTRKVLERTILARHVKGADLDAIQEAFGAERYDTPFPRSIRLFFANGTEVLDKIEEVRAHPDIVFAGPRIVGKLESRQINDPLLNYFSSDVNRGYQWHLRANFTDSFGQQGLQPHVYLADPNFPTIIPQINTSGTRVDGNVTAAWSLATGNQISVAVADDGVETAHPDLEDNIPLRPSQSADTNNDGVVSETEELAERRRQHEGLHLNEFTGTDDPTPSPSSLTHGTSVAGVTGAVANNGYGGAGVAYNCWIHGLRLLSDAGSGDEGIILGFSPDIVAAAEAGMSEATIHVHNNSWGPPDNAQIAGMSLPAAFGIEQGITNGRGGLGTIYVWAGGNGGAINDNVNYDGYANSIFTIAVGAVNDDGVKSFYSDRGAPLVVCAPSNDLDSAPDPYLNRGITTTTTTGDNPTPPHYRDDFGGTSSATPLVSGVVALMLEANPELGWRDVQEILMTTATRINAVDTEWRTNSGGFNFNHKYGAGLVNGLAAVQTATTWTNLGSQFIHQVAVDNNPGNDIDDVVISRIIEGPVSGALATFNLSNLPNIRVEHVEVSVNITHPNRGELEVSLESPDGMVSILSENHGAGGSGYRGWTFMTVRNWGSVISQGQWILKVRDTVVDSGIELSEGTLDGAEIFVYGSVGPDQITYEEWAEMHFTAAELLDPNISGPLANPDGDDCNNLIEYAGLTDPNNPDECNFNVFFEPNEVVATFQRDRTRGGISYRTEVTTNNLNGWQNTKWMVLETEGSKDDIKAWISNPTAKRLFVRQAIDHVTPVDEDDLFFGGSFGSGGNVGNGDPGSSFTTDKDDDVTTR